MSATLIDGKLISLEIRADISRRVKELGQSGIVPGLATVLVGNNPASQVYVRNKRKQAIEAGMYSELHELGQDCTEAELMERIARLNRDSRIHGILIQLPLPRHLDERKMIERIDPAKDVDGLHPVNAGKLLAGTPGFIPCTPFGVMKILDYMHVGIEGQNAVVLGRSILVGKPVALLLLQRNATVTVCHSKSRDLAEMTRRADILVLAIGRPNFVTGEMIKPGSTVIDVGINRLPDGRLTGDADFETVSKKAGMLTPVPGGVGPMTIAMLLQNTLLSAEREKER